MLSYITVGANDVPRSGRFYAAILIPLGYAMKEAANGVEFTRPGVPGRANGPGAVYVKKPYDGKEATVGNGSMTAFQAETHAMVRNLHAAGLEAGGSDEGAPGFRDEYSAHFYVGYLRDPLGNKVAIFCANPAEGTRGR
ncbi:VOC family protein [Plastoroseomonas hellenica]|uniref:VOC family protein n=1 Tax=Plastoroseomonas hellenica TaxID=2687306 RepID=UPI001BAA8177|nr:VOC family protein [Plastoroseomonas hellenica]MBR0646816.1 VOC family protein [Plastoroseomonas hellenica]